MITLPIDAVAELTSFVDPHRRRVDDTDTDRLEYLVFHQSAARRLDEPDKSPLTAILPAAPSSISEKARQTSSPRERPRQQPASGNLRWLTLLGNLWRAARSWDDDGKEVTSFGSEHGGQTQHPERNSEPRPAAPIN